MVIGNGCGVFCQEQAGSSVCSRVCGRLPIKGTCLGCVQLVVTANGLRLNIDTIIIYPVAMQWPQFFMNLLQCVQSGSSWTIDLYLRILLAVDSEVVDRQVVHSHEVSLLLPVRKDSTAPNLVVMLCLFAVPVGECAQHCHKGHHEGAVCSGSGGILATDNGEPYKT